MACVPIVCTDWPVAIVEWPTEASANDLKLHFDELSRILTARPGRVAFVVDATRATGLGVMLRAEAASGIRGILARHGSRFAGVAYAVTKPVARGIITAIHWIAGAPFPVLIAGSREEALAWARERVGARGTGTKTLLERPRSVRRNVRT